MTMPDWEVRSSQIRGFSELSQVGWAPVVPTAQRQEYANYTLANQRWIEEGLRIQGRQSVSPEGISPVIYPVDPSLINPEFALPIWQIGPTPDISIMVNQDLLTASAELQSMIISAMETNRPWITAASDLEHVWKAFYTWYGLDDEGMPVDEMHPTSSVFFPIRPDFESSEVVGFVTGSITWDLFFHDMIPDGLNGFVVYMHDPCGMSYSYAIDGSKSSLIGEGDLHDPQYNHLASEYSFIPELTTPECAYSITVYPGRVFERYYETNTPAIYTSVVVLVFFFTAMVFILYDFLVTRRQSIVSHAAAKTQALVSSLFPKNVQQRILDDANEQAMNDYKAKSHNGFRGKAQLKDFLDGDEDFDERDANSSAFATRPIADLFPETTVLFADIAGFTAWSSTREPSQVFALLETVRFCDRRLILGDKFSHCQPFPRRSTMPSMRSLAAVKSSRSRPSGTATSPSLDCRNRARTTPSSWLGSLAIVCIE